MTLPLAVIAAVVYLPVFQNAAKVKRAPAPTREVKYTVSIPDPRYGNFSGFGKKGQYFMTYYEGGRHWESIPVVVEDGNAKPLPSNGFPVAISRSNSRGYAVGVLLTKDAWDTVIVWKNNVIASFYKVVKKDNFVEVVPRGISSDGAVAGFVEYLPETYRKVFFYRDGQLTHIETPDHPMQEVRGVNRSGTIIGNASARLRPGYPTFIWQNGTGRELTAPGFGELVFLKCINDRGDIVGFYKRKGQNWSHAFRYRDGKFEDISPGVHSADPEAMNSKGDIVGWTMTEDREETPVLWSRGKMLDLNKLIDSSLGITLSTAEFIADDGRIGCSGKVDGKWEFFILTPVEPRIDLEYRGTISD